MLNGKDGGTEKRERRGNRRFSLTLFYAAFTYLVLLLSMGVALLSIKLFVHYDFLMHIPQEFIPDMNQVLLFILLISLVVGALLSLPMVQLQLVPLRRLINGMNRLASGDFRARLRFPKLVTLMPSYAEMEESFNKMAAELENNQLLRKDFVNNFSHEFKTPIVSIAGFAKILQRGGLSEEEQKEYLSAIAEESLRLSNMATNVLHLSRLEKQTILSDIRRYNVSEQIRGCILLLEHNWNVKNIDWALELDEYELEANEEQLKQVWINLLDNAVKFSPEGSTIELCATEEAGELTVTLTNPGTIAPEALDKVWYKFYQGDESHSTAGNGIGLAIVKRITELYGGSVRVESEDGKVRFMVKLPVKQ